MENEEQALTQSPSGIPSLLSGCKDLDALVNYVWKLEGWLKKKYWQKDLKEMSLGQLQQVVIVCWPASNIFTAD